jgi:enoyl-CoA hydratase/carnithine racemase
VTVLRFRQREALAGVDLGVVSGLWDLLEGQTRDPKPVLLAIAPPDLLGPRNLDRMIGTPTDWEGPTASEISARIIREENVIQRFIKAIRGLRSYVIGAVDGEIALHLAAPLLACDYRIVGSEAVFVNVIDRCPRAPLGGIPWLLTKMVGSAAATHILLDQPSLSATEALELGLVNHIVEPGGLDKASLEIAERFGSFHAEALIALKQAAAASPDELASYLRQESTLVERLAFPGRSRVRMMEE